MEGFCTLASGSQGNCLYFGNKKTKILIDAGLNAKTTKSRLAEIGVDLDEIEAIFITHEHSDHIHGLKTLAFKHEIPIIANAETAKAICHYLHECPNFKIFCTQERFQFANLSILPFSVQHDAIDPVGFTITFDGLKIGICTDLGFATSLVCHHLKGCDHLVIESNHEPYMVHASSRPTVYKQRVLSRSGHLSNEECADLVAEILHKDLKTIQLAHLSKECNNPEKALERVSKKLVESGAMSQLTLALQEQIGERIYF